MSHSKARRTKARPPLAPQRSGRRKAPPPSPVRIVKADGTEEVVAAGRFRRERSKVRAARRWAQTILDRARTIERDGDGECSPEAARALAVAEVERRINDGKAFALVLAQLDKLTSDDS